MLGGDVKTVLLIATLDTKGEEAAYLRDRILACGKSVIVLDAGMLGSPKNCLPDIRRERVIEAAGITHEELGRIPRHRCEELMMGGAARIARELYEQGKVHAVAGIGGVDGTLIATAAMRALPLGVPKLVISAAACGRIRFGDYVGTKDVMVLPSVADLLGLNEILCKVLDNAAGAISGMLDAGVCAEVTQKNLVATTAYGQTTPAANAGRALLEAAGYRMVAFHPNGAGGTAMEELIRSGTFAGVWDLTTQELTDHIVMHRASGGETRLEAASDLGIPQVVVPGCIDFVWDAPDVVRQSLAGRLSYLYNPSVLLVKITPDEARAVGRLMAHKLNRCRGPLELLLPLKGISMFDVPGAPLYQPEVHEALFSELRLRLNPAVPIFEIDAHINDLEFVTICVKRLASLMESAGRATARESGGAD
jgi:uncharacterized protein (UPF0261 family)